VPIVAVTETMSDTETDAGAPPPDTAEPESQPAAAPQAPGGLGNVLAGGDHKTTGRLFIGFALAFLAVSGVAGGLLGLEKVDAADFQILSGSGVSAAFTIHSVTAVFLFLLPLILGLAIYLVPLQVGASTIAFPRAAALAFWTWVLSGALLLASYAIDGGPTGGDRNGVLLWLTALAAVTLALALATVCVLATVLTLRTTGMRLDLVPLFSWSLLTAGTIWLMSLGVLFGLLVLLWLDVRYGVELLTGTGGIYARLVWLFLPPQVIVFAVPALGVVAEVVPVFARTPLPRRPIVLGTIGAVAALGFGAWMIILPEAPDLVDEALFIGMAVVVLLPLLGFAGCVADAIRSGRISLAPPSIAVGLGLLLILAGAAAGAFGVLPFNDLVPTTWFAGTAHLVLGGASVVAIGAIYYWAPKIWGRVLADGTGRLAIVIAAVGVVLLAVPDLVTGAQGQDARLPPSQITETGWDIQNGVSLIGGSLLLLAVLLVLVSLAGALAGRTVEAAPDDPWEGHTLEWSAPSPPPVGNFPEAPAVTSATPLLRDREPAETSG
jgi:heme/copper-type cytochrome/quinol oxidase subunit 1